jgi:hypothetical protein
MPGIKTEDPKFERRKEKQELVGWRFIGEPATLAQTIASRPGSHTMFKSLIIIEMASKHLKQLRDSKVAKQY